MRGLMHNSTEISHTLLKKKKTNVEEEWMRKWMYYLIEFRTDSWERRIKVEEESKYFIMSFKHWGGMKGIRCRKSKEMCINVLEKGKENNKELERLNGSNAIMLDEFTEWSWERKGSDTTELNPHTLFDKRKKGNHTLK